MTSLLLAFKAHQDELHGYLVHRVSNAEQAKDLLQEVFLRAIRHEETFQTVANPRAWLFQVARNLVVDAFRRTHPVEPLPSSLIDIQEDPETIDLLTECLGRNLARLTPSDQDILQHCDLEGATVKSYALKRALSLPAAKARLLRARKRLRRSLEKHCNIQLDAQGKVCCYTPPR